MKITLKKTHKRGTYTNTTLGDDEIDDNQLI